MRIQNGSNDPVEWEQTGGGPGPEGEDESQDGQLTAQTGTDSIPPVGTPPWAVTFTNLRRPMQPVTSPKFSDPDATVTLHADWTVTVS